MILLVVFVGAVDPQDHDRPDEIGQAPEGGKPVQDLVGQLLVSNETEFPRHKQRKRTEREVDHIDAQRNLRVDIKEPSKACQARKAEKGGSAERQLAFITRQRADGETHAADQEADSRDEAGKFAAVQPEVLKHESDGYCKERGRQQKDMARVSLMVPQQQESRREDQRDSRVDQRYVDTALQAASPQ